jgi:hypothetical protein
MGNNLSADLATMDIELEQAIAIQLRGNHYPPVPLSMVQPCIDAINAYNEDEPDKLIPLPEGVSWRGNNEATAYAIIEAHHLDAWCNHAEWCDCEDCIYTEE